MCNLRPICWILPIIVGILIIFGSQHFGDITIDDVNNQTFDYIIIGGGTAGTVLANRLSANANISVLLIEAGDEFNLISRVPFLATLLQKTDVDWQYQSTPQEHSSIGFNKCKQNLPRGKGLGGCSQINYMLHSDTVKCDILKWEDHGLHLDFGNNYLLPVTSIADDYSELSVAFKKAADIINLKHAKLAKYNTLNGTRFSTFQAYLSPVLERPNLHILRNTRAHKINFERNSPRSISISPENSLNELTEIGVHGEVILSAGAVNSPHILLHSGIGPKQTMEHHNIPLVHDSPAIGQNLYDHLIVPLYVTLDEPVSLTRDKILASKELFAYYMKGTGILTNFGVIGYANSDDFTHSVGIFGVGAIDEQMLREKSNYNQETFRAIFPHYENGTQEGLVLLNSCHQPVSRGSVFLNSARTADPAGINPNYLHKNDDIKCTIRAIRMAIKLMATASFQAFNAHIVWPYIEDCEKFGSFADGSPPNDAYLKCLIETIGMTAHHLGGTCAMGTKPSSPIDQSFMVRGVDRVRVVDASILPTPVSGTPHGTVVSIAELAAQIILSKKK